MGAGWVAAGGVCFTGLPAPNDELEGPCDPSLELDPPPPLARVIPPESCLGMICSDLRWLDRSC